VTAYFNHLAAFNSSWQCHEASPAGRAVGAAALRRAPLAEVVGGCGGKVLGDCSVRAWRAEQGTAPLSAQGTETLKPGFGERLFPDNPG